MITDLSQSPPPYNNPVWLALDRARRALDTAREVAAQSSESHPGDASAILRSAANFLLRRAAEYDPVRPRRCPNCDDSDLIYRLAWVDARTRELAEFVGPDDPGSTDIDYPFYCGRCSPAREIGDAP